MNNNLDCVLAMPGNAATGGMPFVAEPEDMDQWPEAAVTENTVATIIEIIKRGYQGVKIECYSLSGGRMVVNYLTNEETPEGVILPALLAFAREGTSLPTAKVISVLERIYREHNLPPPKKQKSTARPVAGSKQQPT